LSLAIFDLDNTLIAGDSDHAWGEFLVEEGLVDKIKFKQANDEFYNQYQTGTLDINAYLRFALQPLSHYTLPQLREMHAVFFTRHIAPAMLPKAQAKIEEHRDKGDRLLIITATNRFITEPIAKAFGITEMLASEAEIKNNRYTGEPMGIPCFQEGKVKRLNQWLSEQGETLSNSHFYSDSINDLPLLETVDYPVAVDPDSRLHATALDRGWPVISLR